MYTLSIVLNLHRKSDLVEKTIQNLEKIIDINKQVKRSWKIVEICVTLDNSDDATKSVVYKYKELFSTIDEVHFKDLALSRNYGVSKAKQNFILFADGDDYFSHNTLEELYKTLYSHYNSMMINSKNRLENLKDTEHIVVFPHYYIEFPKLLQAEYFDSTEFTVQNNKFLHCFGSRTTIAKSLLLKYKLHADVAPYGYEDWDLNNRLLASGVLFKTANYKLYYRRGDEESLLAKQLEKKNIVRNSSLYHYTMINKNLKPLEHSNTEKVIPNIPQRGRIWRMLAKSSILKKIYHRIRPKEELTHDINSSKSTLSFEEDKIFLENYSETVSMRNDIQHYSLKEYSLSLSLQTKIYNQLMDFFLHKEAIYFFPWIVMGGADKVSIAYTNALSTKNSCVITNIRSGERINHINIPHLDLISGINGWSNISEDDQLHILTKAIINSHIKLIHIVNSEILIKILKFYSALFKEYNVKTIISLFCPEYDWQNKQWHGFPVMYPEIFENADLVLLDNHYWYNFFKGLNQGKDFNYKKLSSPTEQMDISYHVKTSDTKKILWASRICNQKLFEVFSKIVHLMPEYTFIIYGSVDEWDHHNQEILNRLIEQNNIEFRGTYQHITELNLDEFDLYLFTSFYEGIPTSILDMIMGGIPIVSANVGGISEVLGEEYPLLVSNEFNEKEYVQKIKDFYLQKNSISTMILKVRDTIINEYNERKFIFQYSTYIKEILDDE